MPLYLPFIFSLGVATLAFSSPAQAQEPPPSQQAEQLLQQAEQQFEQLEYEDALKSFIAVHQVPDATPIQRARSFLYMGVCFTAMGNADNAIQSFIELLKLKADFRMPEGVSPAVQEMFKEALKRLKMPETPQPGAAPSGGGGASKENDADKPPVALEAKVPAKAQLGSALDVPIKVMDPDEAVEDLVLHWRLVGGPDFSTIRLKYGPEIKEVTGRIPGAMLGDKPGKLQLYVEAKGKGGATLALAGSAEAPKEVSLEQTPEPTSSWGWWALGIGGGLAVAGGIVAAILLTRGDNGGTDDLAHIQIMIR